MSFQLSKELTAAKLKDDEKITAVMMCLIHDAAETITGDITPSDGINPGKMTMEPMP